MSGIIIEIDKVPSMTHSSSEVSDDALTVEVQESIIDNPGGGDCGFYAFAIGLIDIILKEYALTGKSKTYDQWKSQGLHHVSLQEILDIDLNELYHSPGNYKKELLFKLQMSLRTIACNIYKNEPINRIITEAVLKDGRANIEATPIFCKFMELVDFFLGIGDSLAKISQFNELALSREVQELAIETAHSLAPLLTDKSEKEARRIQNARVKAVFLKDIVIDRKANPDSIILKGMDKIKEKGRWATHYDLKEIADQLHVNLHVVGKENGRDKPSYPVITLYNMGNSHWTTKVTLVRKISKALTKPTKPLGDTSLAGLSSKKIIELETDSKPPKKDTVSKKLPTQDQSFSKTEVGTKKIPPELMNPEKTKRQPQYYPSKQSLFNHNDEIPLMSMSSKADQKELNRLIHIIHRAVIVYCTYSDGIVFSLLHRHGKSGRSRASKFDEEFSLVEDLDQAKNMLMDFLEDSKNGNTHPHSFRTMLLQGLLAANEPHDKKDLNYISKNYSTLLDELKGELTPDKLVIF
ncbi:TPA: hypothetical protein ACTXXA_002746 [Legionella anisa]